MTAYNAATILNSNNYGQIKEGYTASMVLLDDNPLLEIKNTRKIYSVILIGRVLYKITLTQMMH